MTFLQNSLISTKKGHRYPICHVSKCFKCKQFWEWSISKGETTCRRDAANWLSKLLSELCMELWANVDWGFVLAVTGVLKQYSLPVKSQWETNVGFKLPIHWCTSCITTWIPSFVGSGVTGDLSRGHSRSSKFYRGALQFWRPVSSLRKSIYWFLFLFQHVHEENHRYVWRWNFLIQQKTDWNLLLFRATLQLWFWRVGHNRV